MDWRGWGGGTGWLGWLGIGLMMLIFWGLLFMAVAWLVRAAGSSHANISAQAARPNPQQILDERLARGELTEEEYVRRRDLLRAR